MTRRKLRTVRHYQWVRWLRYFNRLPAEQHKLKIPLAWYRKHRWMK